jgi:hypothetical protein
MDKNAGEKGKKVVYYVYYRPKSPYNSLRSLQAVLVYLYPRYEARKGSPKPCPNGEIKVTDDVVDYP